MKSLRSKWLCAFLLAIAVAAVGYGRLAYEYWSNPPRLTRNYTAELNAPILNVPEAQRAWPIYREVLIELAEQQPQPAVRDYLRDESYVLSDSGLADWVRSCEPSLAKARQAARLPSLGYVLLQTLPPEELQLALCFTAKEDREKRTKQLTEITAENAPLTQIVIQPLDMGALTKCLSADALLAARDGDGRRATDDLHALLGIAEHVRQLPLFHGEFVAWQRSTGALKLWGRLLEQYPDAFDDRQLQDLEAAVRNRSIGDLNAAFAAARIEFLDQVQRAYGDDGTGDGLLFSTAGLTYADPALDSPAGQARIFSPLRARFLPSRRETIAEYDALHSLAAAEAARPYWECDVWKSEERYNRLRVERRHPLILEFGGYGETLNRLQQGYLQARDAMLTASTLVRFRRKQRAWPKTLAELVPAYMPELPIDRFAGKQLGYVVKDSQPVLYAVGLDHRDDGGIPAQVFTTHRKHPGADLDRNDFPWYWDFWRGTQDGDLILWPVAPPETKAKAPADELD